MNYGDIQLDQLVNEIALASKEAGSNYVYRKSVVEAVEAQLLAGGLPLSAMADLIQRAAEREVDRYFNRRKPKIGAQGAIYFPEFWLPLGAGKRIQMCDATDLDVTAWAQGIENNRRAVNIAADRTNAYAEERIAAWARHPGRNLHWVETHEFGYVVEESDPADYFYEETCE